jgi:hypothetical protein
MRSPVYAVLAAVMALAPSAGQAQTAGDILGPAGVVPLATPQPPARIIVDPPLPGPLAEGKVFIQYRAENLRIEPVFGPPQILRLVELGHRGASFRYWIGFLAYEETAAATVWCPQS